MDEPIRVLQVLGGTNLGGAESRVMDLYRNMDRTKVQFDFAVHTQKKGFFDEEIESLGGHIYRLPRFVVYNWFPYQKAWKQLFAAHSGYACVHGHMTSTASLYLPIAKKAGVRVTAAHARSAGVDSGMKGTVTRLIRRPLAKRADFCFGASALAGEAVFGKKAAAQGKVFVWPNAIEAGRYAYDRAMREKMRAQLMLGQSLVLGHVGRFHPCKNHTFLLDIFAAVCDRHADSRLLLLGEGDGMEEIRKKARELGVLDRVEFLGNRANVSDYYQAMDCFVFPSLYEGMPGTVLEAQTAGLSCVIADTVTREVGITDLASFLPLTAPKEVWAAEILKKRPDVRRSRAEEIRRSGYDIKTQAAQLQHFYETGELPALTSSNRKG